jgi:hypothetical protein
MPKDLPDRQLRLEKLCNLQVHGAKQIFTQISVKIEGSEVQGSEESTVVALSGRGQSLSIHMLEDDLLESFFPEELGEVLCQYCQVPRRCDSIVFQILSSRDSARIEDFLKRKGLVLDFSDIPGSASNGKINHSRTLGSWIVDNHRTYS